MNDPLAQNQNIIDFVGTVVRDRIVDAVREEWRKGTHEAQIVEEIAGVLSEHEVGRSPHIHLLAAMLIVEVARYREDKA